MSGLPDLAGKVAVVTGGASGIGKGMSSRNRPADLPDAGFKDIDIELEDNPTFTGDFAHADFSATAAEAMLRRNLPPGEAEARLRGPRFAVFNVWRAFSGPPQDVPLARCDARSVAPQDKQYCEITLKSAAGDLLTWENITYYHNQAHRWWYCPDMTRDEAYVFRSFDSAPGHAEQVPHSAFVNESCPASAPPRASVEVRVFAFYDED
jgi:hypothetical protein